MNIWNGLRGYSKMYSYNGRWDYLKMYTCNDRKECPKCIIDILEENIINVYVLCLKMT